MQRYDSEGDTGSVKAKDLQIGMLEVVENKEAI
jgi:hypothetical protein